MSKAGKPGRGEKAQAIREALKSHPHLKNRELAEVLIAKGIKCSSQDIANQKARFKRLAGDSSKQNFTVDDLPAITIAATAPTRAERIIRSITRRA